MSYQNFKPDFWSRHIYGQTAKMCVFQEDANYEYEGEISEGATLTILGVGRPTIGTYTGASIGDPEVVPDSSIKMVIDQAKYFNFAVDDVDKAQGKKGLMEKLSSEAALGLAETRDTFLASLTATNAGAYSSSAAITTADGAKSAVDVAFEFLWDNGVKLGARGTQIIIPTWFYTHFKDKMTELATDNVNLLKEGIVGMYNGAAVKLSNNLFNDGTDDYLVVKTNKAMAFAAQIDKVEAFRPHTGFKDAMKGLDLYGGKIVRPNEMYVIKARKA